MTMNVALFTKAVYFSERGISIERPMNGEEVEWFFSIQTEFVRWCQDLNQRPMGTWSELSTAM